MMFGCLSLRFGCKRRTSSLADTDARPAPQLQPDDNAHSPSREVGSVACGELAQECQRLLCRLQKEICKIHTSPLEGRNSAVVDAVLRSLSASRVRLYGVSGAPSADGAAGLVLIAAAERPVSRQQPETLLTAGMLRDPSVSVRSRVSEYPGSCQDEVPSLLHRAVTTKEPVMFQTSSCDIRSSNQHPAVAHRTTLAALPLLCGDHVLGVICITADEAAVPAAHDLLSHSVALNQLSFAMWGVLMGAAAVDGSSLPYPCWLAGVVRRLTTAMTLHALVVELTAALEDHVRRLYLLDVAVHVALVPAADSDVAYVLSQEAPSPPHQAPTAIICSGTLPGSRQQCGTGAAGGSERSVPMPLTNDMASDNTDRMRQGGLREGTMAPNGALTSNGVKATVPSPVQQTLGGGAVQPSKRAVRPVFELRRRASSAGNARHVPGGPNRLRESMLYERSPNAKRIGADTRLVKTTSVISEPIPSALCDNAGSDSSLRSADSASTPPPATSSLRAKAMAMSYTLLQSLMETSGSGANIAANPDNGVGDSEALPNGVIVASCKRWITELRRPCRDVCIMMAGARGSPQTSPPKTPETLAARSLVLLGVPLTSDDGCRCNGAAGDSGGGGDGMFLGLYLAFSTSLPPQLLDAVRGSCRGLLQWSLARILQGKLQEPLAPEVEALRAGVPGHYTVIVPSPAVIDPVADRGIVGAAVPVTPGSRDQARNVTGGLVSPFLPASITSSSLAGEVLPPGRLARTVTYAQSSSSMHLTDPGAPSSSATSTIAVMTLESTAGAGGGFETASDIQFTIELGGRVPFAPSPGQAALARAATAPHGAAPNTNNTDNINKGSLPTPPNRQPRGSSWRSLEASSPCRRKNAAAVTTQQPQSPQLLQQQAASFPADGTSPASRPHEGLPQQAVVDDTVVVTADELQQLASGYEVAVRNGSGSHVVVVPTAAAAATLTVQQADDEDGMLRAHLGLMVESLLGSIRSAAAVTDTSLHNGVMMQTSGTSPYDTMATRRLSTAQQGTSTVVNGAEDILTDLQLYDVLGEGASGVVLRGLLGTVPVAVKLIEMPRLEESASPPPQGAQASILKKDFTLRVSAADPVVVLAPEASGTDDAPRANLTMYGTDPDGIITKELLAARQCLYRNAMELAVLTSTTHVNIVQCLGVYENVIIDHVLCGSGERFSMLRRFKEQEAVPGSPICTAILTELCDSSLSTALADHSFPTQLKETRNKARSSKNCTIGVGPLKYDMRGVWLTVLEIALALRHLHGRRLVHRDLKPANILLKVSSDDPRGWKTKLADFGFALLLEREGSLAASVGASEAVQPNTGTRAASGSPAANCGSSAVSPRQYNGTAQHPLAGLPSNAGNSSDPRGGLDLPAGLFYTIQEQACGTLTHMAPEAMKSNARIDASVDVFSLGIIMWELVAGRGHRPYRHLRPNDIPEAVLAGIRPIFPAWVPMSYRKLAQACWASNPACRPSAMEVVLAVKEQLGKMTWNSS